MGGASNNHVTFGHVTFPEASSTPFWYLELDEEDPLLFSPPLFSGSTCVQIILCGPFPYIRRNVSFLPAALQHFQVLWSRLYTFFTLWDSMSCSLIMYTMFVMFCNYVYYVCIENEGRCCLHGLCFFLPKYSV